MSDPWTHDPVAEPAPDGQPCPRCGQPMAASRASYAADGTLICPTCMMAEQSRHAAKTIRTKSRSELAGVVLLVVVLLGVSCFCGLSIWISQMLR